MKINQNKMAQLAFGSILFVSAAGLLFYAWLGLYNRYWADDWCYNADYYSLGLLGILNGYNYITYYASNRISLTLFSVLFEQLGLVGVQLLPLILLGLSVHSLFLILKTIFQRAGLSARQLALLTFSTVLIYITFYLAPNQFQVLYWRSGAMPYTTPLIGSLYIFAFLLSQWGKNTVSNHIFLFFLVLITGLFSESGWAVLFAGLVLGLLFTGWRVMVGKTTWNQAALLMNAFIAALIALAILMLSPANELRQVNYPERTSLLLVPVYSFIYAADFAVSSIKSFILPTSLLAALFYSFAAFTGWRADRTHKQFIWIILAIVLAALLLMAANQAPSVYIEKGPPHPRALIASRLVWCLALAAISFLAGAQYPLKFKYAVWLNLLLIGLVSVYLARTVWLETQQVPTVIARSQVWDARDFQIRQAVTAGEQSVLVEAIDGATMDNTRDFKEKPNFWLNACAARYYGIAEIVAGPPKGLK